jgi:hypothetical protein
MVARTVHLGNGTPVPNHYYATRPAGCERNSAKKDGKIPGGDEGMMRTNRRLLTALASLLVAETPLRAGMPAPLPTEVDLARVFRLTDTAGQRLQVISFFLLGLLLSAGAVQLLWNIVRRDVPQLATPPR